jgi:hypothetical protein
MSYKVAYDHWVADRQERLRRRRAPAPLAETPANDEARSGYQHPNLPASYKHALPDPSIEDLIRGMES